MPTLFRDVRLDDLETAVIYHDKDDLTWITWPAKPPTVDADESQGESFQVILANMRRFEGQLQAITPTKHCRFITHENGLHIDIQQSSTFTRFRWQTEPGSPTLDESILPSLLPAPPSLSAISEVASDLERVGISQSDFAKQIIREFLSSYQIPNPGQFSPKTLFIGFERRYLGVSSLAACMWGHLLSKQDENLAYVKATGMTTIEQIVNSLDIHILGTLSTLTTETNLTSGDSFQVAIAKNNQASELPPYKDGSERRQWKKNSLVALKRPRVGNLSSVFTSFHTTEKTNGVLEHGARLPDAVINELLILSHPPLRNHPNIVHLFGIGWDEVLNSSTESLCPILVQPCATHGNLSQYMNRLMLNKDVTWTLQCDLTKQLLTGWQQLHASGIVHGDIKTTNILIATESDGTATPRLMISDFGYSIITNHGQEQVQLTGMTKRYAAPEIYRCFESSETKIFLKDAFASDIYSLGLVACSIFLICRNSRDIFGELSSQTPRLVSQKVVDPSTAKKMSKEDFWQETKTNPRAHDCFVACIMMLMMWDAVNVKGVGDKGVIYLICRCLQGSSDDKLEVIPKIIEHLAGIDLGEGSSDLHSVASTGDAIKHLELDRHRKRNLCVLNVGRSLHHFLMHEVEVSGNNELQYLSFRIRQQILKDFEFKAKPLIESSFSEWPALRCKFGLRKWAKIVYASYQAFLCHLLGVGTELDLAAAGKYLAASSLGGCIHAVIAAIMFHKRYPHVILPDWTPNLEGLFQIVLMGPVEGLPRHLADLNTLRTLAPDLAQEAVKTINEAAFSELGESHGNGCCHEEESFLGPDVRYQWFAQGSLGLLRRVISSCKLTDLMQGFQSGIFPTDATNDSNETILYMCCRIGASELVLGLLKEFSWCRRQTMVATLNGRLPLHFLYTFPEVDVNQVADALLANGADVNSVDVFGFRAVDYAIQAGREDVVTCFLRHHTTPFSSNALRVADVKTFTVALKSGSPAALSCYLRHADFEAKLDGLVNLTESTQMLYSPNLLSALPALLSSIGRLSVQDMDSSSGEVVRELLLLARSTSDMETFNSIVEHLLPDKGLPIDFLVQLLQFSLLDLRQAEFSTILGIKASWTAFNGYKILKGLADAQGPYKAISNMFEAMIHHLDDLNLLREAVNYVSQLPCGPSCKHKFSHEGPLSLFCTLIWSSHFNMAKLIAPYVKHDQSTPSAMYYILRTPGAKVLEHVAFLMELGEEYRQYVCQPILKSTVLHAVTELHDHSRSPTKLSHTLETLLEYFVGFEGQDIDALNVNGYTALMQAVESVSLEAVTLLLDWGAEPMILADIQPKFQQISLEDDARFRLDYTVQCTPYELVLLEMFIQQRLQAGKATPRVGVITDSLPLPGDLSDQLILRTVHRFKMLVELSSPGSLVADNELRQLIDRNDSIAGLEVKSFMPKTRKRRAELIEREDGSLYLDIWGFYVLKNVRISVIISPWDNGLTEKEVMVKENYYHRMMRCVDVIGCETMGEPGRWRGQCMLEKKAEGWGSIHDWDGPGETLTWKKMIDAGIE